MSSRPETLRHGQGNHDKMSEGATMFIIASRRQAGCSVQQRMHLVFEIVVFKFESQTSRLSKLLERSSFSSLHSSASGGLVQPGAGFRTLLWI